MPLWLLLPLFLPVSALAVSAVQQDIIMALCRSLHMIGRLYNIVRGLGDFVTVRCRRYATAATKAVSLLPDRQSFIYLHFMERAIIYIDRSSSESVKRNI